MSYYVFVFKDSKGKLFYDQPVHFGLSQVRYVLGILCHAWWGSHSLNSVAIDSS